MKLMVVMEMGLDKEFDVEVVWEVKKEVAKDVCLADFCSTCLEDEVEARVAEGPCCRCHPNLVTAVHSSGSSACSRWH